MRVLGLSPLDKDATVTLVEDGAILFAAGEERFSRIKQHAGFPERALAAAMAATGSGPGEIDTVVYPFLDWEAETALMRQSLRRERADGILHPTPSPRAALAAAAARVRPRTTAVHGLASPDARMLKGPLKALAYRALGTMPVLSQRAAGAQSRRWLARARREHRHWQQELLAGLARSGIDAPLERSEHHSSHAAGAYLLSGFDRALVVTLDGYGSGLSGSISVGEGGALKRLHGLRFPYSLGSFYELVTSSLGFQPDRHAGKIVGLAAYGDPHVLGEALLQRMEVSGGDLRMTESLNVYFARHLAERFPMVDVAAAWQWALEQAAVAIVRHWLSVTGCRAVCLSGGVTANVKLNQRIHEIPGVEAIFVDPDMGDGGCGTGLALARSWPGGVREPLRSAYLGREPTRKDMLDALAVAGLRFSEPKDLLQQIARRVHAGQVVARCAGRMEYGPRALGNRSILYHAREPEVNQWLNQRLLRTEFMPFAPVTLWEAKGRCYEGLSGAEHAAEFMTITFDCTAWMKASCPAAVHVDGTARPQLLRREINPDYHTILVEYEKLSGIPCLINTSFNMHEEPIVESPADAVRAFLLGHLDALALGPFLVESPERH